MAPSDAQFKHATVFLLAYQVRKVPIPGFRLTSYEPVIRCNKYAFLSELIFINDFLMYSFTVGTVYKGAWAWGQRVYLVRTCTKYAFFN